MLKEILNEIINEAKTGQILIADEKFPVGFNTIIYNDENKNFINNNLPETLIIKNKDKFEELLKEYIELEIQQNRKCYNFIKENKKDYIKFIIMSFLINATSEDFNNPINMINRYISFLNDNTFKNLENGILINLENTQFNCSLKIQNMKQSLMMETPNKMEFKFIKTNNNETLEYLLPNISYGIENNECYIYSIINKETRTSKNQEELKFKKRINRLMYKFNKNVEQDSGDIKDVSPSALLSMTLFISLLKKKNITKIKLVPYLPLRYESRDITANGEENISRKNDLKERNDFIQTNITDKFINTLLRVKHHTKNIDILSYPYELDEYLTIKLNNNSSKIDNDLLNEITSVTNKHI